MAGTTTSAALYAAVSSSSKRSREPEDAKDLTHHAKGGKGFINPWDSYREWTAPQIIRMLLWRKITGKTNTPDTKTHTVTVRKPQFLQTRDTPSLRATWLGHACYFVEFPKGLRVLFDPVLTPRCSPFSWIGPKRYTDAPCQIEDIPFLDAVVISHSHYDHLSYPTVLRIKDKFPNAHFFVPLSNKKWFVDCGVTNVTELDWWQSSTMTLSRADAEAPSVISAGQPTSSNQAEITATLGCLPCQHISARSPFDKGHTLWSSWSVESGGSKLYFGGSVRNAQPLATPSLLTVRPSDTGYRSIPFSIPEDADDYAPEYADLPTCPAFKQIGNLRGPFDLGLIPIGAYAPRHIMSPMHANPYDSVNIFLDTKCKRAMGIHWGTWVLTEEDVLEPPRLLRDAMEGKGLPATGVFDVCHIGESREFESAGSKEV